MATHVCRLCRATITVNRSVSLFSHGSIQRDLPARISGLLDDANDGLPLHVCCKCKCRLETLEKAARDLEDFQRLVRDSYAALLPCRGGLKKAVVRWGYRQILRECGY